MGNWAPFHAGQAAVLERIARGEPLEVVLEAIVRLLEGQSEGVACTVLVLDRERGVLRHGAAPSVPAEYARALDGVAIGPEVGSCGAAAFRGVDVEVEDIATHPYWEKYRALALPHGLRACWSSPILGAAGGVLGTFALYASTPRRPTDDERALVAAATHLASIALERDENERRLREGEAAARRLARVYAVSSHVSQALVGLRDPEALYASACRIPVDAGLASLAWFGTYDADAGGFSPVARAGRDDGYVDTIAASAGDPRIARGPGLASLRSGKVTVVDDVERAHDFPFREEALARGFRSCVSIPLAVRGAPRAVFALYADEPHAFGDQERKVLAELGASIAFADEAAETERERRRLAEQLRHAQKMEAIGRLASGVAHDFNNVLSVILSYATFLGDGAPPGSALREDLDEIRKAAERAARLTAQLLALGRRQVLRPKLVRLPEVVSGLAPMLQRLLGRTIELVFRFEADVGPVWVDPGSLEQVLLNLTVNARDAMPDGGSLVVATRPATATVDDAPRAYAELSVTDTGVGMDAPTRAKIFEPFFTTKDAGKGTGLGLAMVDGIVGQSGGTVRVESEPGRGTTFRVRLPVAAEERPAASPSPAGGARRAGKPGLRRVMHVDDEEALVQLTARVLGGLGYEVSSFTEVEGALDDFRVRPGAFDVVVSDVSLGPASGFDLVREVRALRPDVPVVLVSGAFRPEDLRLAERLGIRDLVVKPGSVDELGKVLDGIFARS